MFRGPVGALALVAVVIVVVLLVTDQDAFHKGCASVDASLSGSFH